MANALMRYAILAFIATLGISLPIAGQNLVGADSLIQDKDTLLREYFLGERIEEQATPKSGYDELFKKISEEINFPDTLTEKGRVFIQFIVDTVGNIRSPEVIKGFNVLAEKEALRAFKKVDEKFYPAQNKGKAVNTRLIIHIVFDPETDKNTY